MPQSKEYARQWYAKNREERLAYQNKYNAEHREERKVYDKERWSKTIHNRKQKDFWFTIDKTPILISFN